MNSTVQSEQLDPAFFDAVNEYIGIANRQAKTHGLKRVSAASLYAAARFNAHAYIGFERDARGSRTEFLDYMTDLYRRMLNEHLDAIGAERGIDVGPSELPDSSDPASA